MFRELQQSLHDLRITSNSTTARLDNTYYSVLEKFSTLQHSLVALQELVAASKNLNDDFLKLSNNVVEEVNEQITILQDYSLQAARINTYQSRLQKSRDKMDELSDRVDAARHRTEVWSRSEDRWEEKTRRNIKIFWGLSVVLLVVMLGLVGWGYIGFGVGGRQGTVEVSFGGRNVSVPRAMATIGSLEEMRAREEEERKVLDGLRRGREVVPVEDDPRLRVFDEL